MQLTGTQFTRTAAVFGNDISTLPDFPAEIRAPAGSLPGVSGFQISFSSSDIHTPGDQPDVLVAMNPAALKTNIGDLPPGGALIVNSDAFTQQNLNKAAYASNPLTDGSLKAFTVFEVPISTLNERSLDGLDMTSKQKDLTKNFFALGLMFWLYERSMDPTIGWIDQKFSARPVIAEANKRALKAGYAFGETTEIFHTHYRVQPAQLPPGTYRNITGNEATALGFLAASKLADRPLFYGSYPITPASDILHQLSGYKTFGVKTFQAEDEIAAIGAAIGASYGGALGMTASSGPGIALKSEAMGLAVMVELPLVVIDVQRAGPSTGMPTKNEQADLLQVMFGRNCDSPMPIVAPATPGRVLRPGHRGVPARAQVHDPGRVPVRRVPRDRLGAVEDPGPRDPARHRGRQRRTRRGLPAVPARPATRSPGRGRSRARPASSTASAAWRRPTSPATSATTRTTTTGCRPCARPRSPASPPTSRRSRSSGRRAASCSSSAGARPTGRSAPRSSACRPTASPSRTPTCGTSTRSRPTPRRSCARYRRVLIPEVNLGQLLMLIRARYLIDAVGYDRVRGKPFRIAEIVDEAERLLAEPGTT